MKKVVLITGGARGIGKTIAKNFANNGYAVVVNYFNSSEQAKQLEKEFKSFNYECLFVKADVSNESQVKTMVDSIIKKYNRIDVLINNSAITNDSLFHEKTAETFNRVLNTNLVGAFNVSKLVGDIMFKQKYGKIINISSTNAIDTYYPESCDYDASKAGVISLTHNLAREFAPNIRVNCVCPGWVKTDMNKDLSIEQINEERRNILVSRFAEAEEIAKVVSFLCSEDASYVNDSIIRVDGGKYNG